MKGIFMWIVMAVLFFGIAQVGTEMSKAFMIHDTLKDKMIGFALDALEISADDTLRMEHVTSCDVQEARGFFISQLDDARAFEKFEVEALEVFAGEYAMMGDRAVQVEEPYLRCKGIIHLSMSVMGYSRMFRLPLEILTTARRAQ